MKLAVTHNGFFHAGEVFAIALLRAINKEPVAVDRADVEASPKRLAKYQYVIGIGKKFDGKKYFDHHQWSAEESNGMGSAGLVFEFVKKKLLKGAIKELEPVVDTIDKQDLGLEEAPNGHIANVIKYYNNDDIYSYEQEIAFNEALSFTTRYVKSVVQKHRKIKKAKSHILKTGKLIDSGRVLVLPEYVPFWNMVDFSKGTLKSVDTVILLDDQQKVYKKVSVKP